MKIALIGYGKMGKAIEQIALDRGHEIVLKIDETNLSDFTKENIAKAGVAIEFTGPHTAYENILKLLDLGVPTISGSTGWLDKMDTVQALCNNNNGSFIYASNFSVGVNLFFELNKKLAALMHPHKEYDVALEEIHHTQKRDAPSGTAITLAEGVMETYSEKKTWVNDVQLDSLLPQADELLIVSKRIDPDPGTHTIRYSSEIDDITITHSAHSRQGFALGAVIAAEFLKDKKGIFTMKEVLGL
ncbi:4-hydroxy-tetrahydrodipicolinate reductase [Niabella ginsengisoli]|uniref:4-hydroxy-tetrahydrodipicolinate reductase n=1 Tax=Niabella ginsengisoli TaxID=522298 RepID=A0ABS9SLX7_9BACT|nr:4-hydroxy-tetrahydrodipicolinate reductase [Niabella ginsengisoli]MCH5599383.1 4-hydroxy-tetrahydrodipicolinate reductase [Niabella ginsengisoli]